jgi:hypothetical protein
MGIKICVKNEIMDWQDRHLLFDDLRILVEADLRLPVLVGLRLHGKLEKLNQHGIQGSITIFSNFWRIFSSQKPML